MNKWTNLSVPEHAMCCDINSYVNYFIGLLVPVIPAFVKRELGV